MSIQITLQKEYEKRKSQVPPPVSSFLKNSWWAFSLNLSPSYHSQVKNQINYFLLNQKKLEAILQPSFVAGLLHKLCETEGIDGDIIELGTYKGGSTIMLARMLSQLNSRRTIYACDTFEGLPYDDQHTSNNQVKGMFSDTNIQYVKNKFIQNQVKSRITVVQGLFEKTLPANFSESTFSFAFIDCDLYGSTSYALEFIESRMPKGSIIGLHDYSKDSHWGCTKAVDEWCQKTGHKVSHDLLPHIQM